TDDQCPLTVESHSTAPYRGHHDRPQDPPRRTRRGRRAREAPGAVVDALGYPPGYFDWAGDARAIPATYVRDNPVFVLEDDGRRLGFYSFTEDDGDLLLDKLFVDADEIGKGCGKLLWQH